MPFLRHIVVPRHLRQGLPSKPEGVRPTLHEFCNLSLTNFIRQLANLSGQVDTIFGNLMLESQDFMRRLDELKTRLASVEEKAKRLNSLKEDVGKGFGKDRKVVYRTIVDRARFFQSEQALDTGLFMENTRPTEVKDLRQSAEAPPRLHELDKYRSDDRECAKIYSNPNLFFLAWQDTLQQMIAEHQAKSTMKAKRTVRQTRLRRVKRAKASRIIMAQKYKMGKEFVPDEKEEKEEDEYFTEEEWSSSDEDEPGNQLMNGNATQPTGNVQSFKASAKDGPIGLAEPPSILVTGADKKLEPESRDYKFNNIDHLDPFDNILPPAPPPPLSQDLESMKLNGKHHPPDMDYSGRSSEYNIQTALDSMSEVRLMDNA